MKTVAYSSPFVPAEWIQAHGLRPHRLRLHSAEDDPRVRVSRGVCPYARAFLRAALFEGEASAVVMTTTCDQMRHAAALVAGGTDRPLFLMNVPSTWQTAAAGKLYRDELRRLGRFLVQLGGRPPSPEGLTRVMLAYDSARASLRAAGHRLPARQRAEAMAALDGDAPAVPEAGPSAADGTALALVGGPLLAEDYAMLDFVEQAGGRLVLDATEGGERTMPAAFDRGRLRDDPLAELAAAYFGAIPDVFRRPNHAFYEWLAAELEARQVCGVLLRRYVWCDLWHAELHRLKRWSPVPVPDVDVCHSQAGSLSRTAGRVEAFLEMLR